MANLHIEIIEHNECEKDSNDVNIEYKSILGLLYINDHSLLKEPYSQVFDLLNLLIIGDTDTEFDLYTCSCGIAGCAGIFRSVKLITTETTIEWKLPTQFYSENSNFSNEDLIFNKQEYMQEINRIKSILLELNKTNKLSITPSTMYVEDCISENELQNFCERTYKHLLKNIKFRKKYQETYGELLNYDIELKFNTQTWILSMSGLADRYAEYLGILNQDEHSNYIRNTLRPLFLNLDTDLSTYINSIGMLAIQELAIIEHLDEENSNTILEDHLITRLNIKIINKSA